VLAVGLCMMLAACGGGGGGGDGGCTPPSVVQLNFTDTRNPNPSSSSSQGIWFGTLEAVQFTPRHADVCGASRSFRVVSGSLPAGVTLDAGTGVVSGIPTASGRFRPVIGLRVSGFGGEATQELDFTADDFGVEYPTGSGIVRAPVGTPLSLAPTITDGTLRDGLVFSPLFRSNHSRGFILPAGTSTAYSVASGTLPPGLSLNPTTGVISGTPTVAGDFNVEIRVVASKDGGSLSNVPDPRSSFTLSIQ
jgi:hypothetical protein